MRTQAKFLLLAVALLASAVVARADAALLLEEPYGNYGSYNPTGHAAVYLSGVCAETPVQLRPCRAGELGAVISRYHRVAGYDWVAVPLIPYLYAVEQAGDVPESVNAAQVADLRDRYRRQHLRSLAPDTPEGGTPAGDWYQLVGSAYDRRLYGFRIRTTRAEDEALIARFNDRRNRTAYSLFLNNCADFAREVLNFYEPGAVTRNYWIDAGVMTPKRVAKALVGHARRHPELDFSSFVIPQVPGTLARSKPVDGIFEGLLKNKKYVVPLTILTPEITGTLAVAYVAKGRFTPARNAPVVDPQTLSESFATLDESGEARGTLRPLEQGGTP